MDDDATQPVSRQNQAGLVQSSLELHVRSRDGSTAVVPFHRNILEHDFGQGQKLRFSYAPGQEVLFRTLAPGEPVYKDGQAAPSGRFEVGSFLEFAGHRVLLWDAGQPAAYLKGYSAPYSGEIWPLEGGQNAIGRPGKRANAIQLDHPTVSREHAIIAVEDGKHRLLAESGTNLVCVAGIPVEPTTVVDLSHGDLIEIGDLVFRFHCPSAAPGLAAAEPALIQVRSLGSFQVQVGGSTIADKDWKTQHIKWMFAHLAFQWGRPLAIESLIEELWPDFTLEKGKNNFNYSLSTLRQILRAHLPEALRNSEVVLRSSSTLQINPDLLDRHDVVHLQRFLSVSAAEKANAPGRWELSAERAVLDYSGPFLTDCYLDWVEPIRQTLELDLLDVAKQLLELRVAGERWEQVVTVATHILKIDPCSQWACLYLMQALRSCQRAPEALRVFEQSRKTLQKELGVEPEVELLREHQRVLALL